MDAVNGIIALVSLFIPALITLLLVLTIIGSANWLLKRRWKEKPDTQFKFQLIMLALTFSGFLAVMVGLPVGDTTRGQLLSLIGILLSAAIALSSTTFIGNIMAGIMLRAVKSARPGDFITVAELTGRITEMSLLHTEVQTEFRDLVTVPNLYMVTQPMQVVRASGTIITAEVSLGYEISNAKIAAILAQATERAGLSDGFVHIRELGDFSVTYRVAGLLEDVTSLISSRSTLRKCMLDCLHEAGIEIVSPNFMNTRAVPDDRHYIPSPAPAPKAAAEEIARAEAVIFDKADDAAQIEKIRKSIEIVDAELKALAETDGEAKESSITQLESTKARLVEELRISEEHQKAAKLSE